MTNHDYEDLMQRVAKHLGWTVEQVRGFSLQALRELVRRDNPVLTSELTNAIVSGAVVVRPA